MRGHRTDSKLPPMKLEKWWGSPEIFLNTKNRNGNNYCLLKLVKGPITQRGKHFYYIKLSSFKSSLLEVMGVDLID
jgi:hypothetical protein